MKYTLQNFAIMHTAIEIPIFPSLARYFYLKTGVLGLRSAEKLLLPKELCTQTKTDTEIFSCMWSISPIHFV